jgi:predicted kinase
MGNSHDCPSSVAPIAPPEQLIEELAKHLNRITGLQSRVYRTHMFSVIVCGGEASKLKRPVKLAQPAKLYAPTTTTKTYQALADLANELVGAALNVIVDAIFLDQAQINRFTQLAHDVPAIRLTPQSAC